MTNNEDNFGWARLLGCPESALTDSIKKSLNSGIGGLLWDELANVVRPSREVLEIRKNILLFKLRHKENDTSIKHIRNLQQLESANSQLEPQIENLEKKCEQNNLLVTQKHQKVSNVKHLRESIRAKEHLFRMKFDQMQTQVKDCREMRVVCQRLMPPTSCEIDSQILHESLSLVGGISTKADKRMAWNRISETLSTSEISTLWNLLLSQKTRDTEELMALGTHEIANTGRHAMIINGENIDIGLARICGEHIAGAVKTLIHRVKADENERSVMDIIEKIETLETNNIDICEWLVPTLEVHKLETEQSCLQSEIDSLRKTLKDQVELENELSNVESDIRSIDTRVEACVLDVQKSLILLKNAGLDIVRTRETLLLTLQKIAAMHNENQNPSYLDIDLGMELNIFHDTIQLEALRKILLKDGVGAYRHTKCCMSDAQRSITTPSQSNNTSQFPMIRAPIYELLNCYKTSLAASWLAKLENELEINEHNYIDELITYEMSSDSSSDAIATLNTTDSTCDKVRHELSQFDSIFDAWNNQTEQKLLALNDRTVNEATFQDWVKRMNTLVYITRRKK